MTRTRSPESLRNLLENGREGLGQVLAAAAELEALTGRVVAALPEPESDHVLAVSARDGRLVVTVDSAAWAARLRFMEREVRIAVGDGIAAGKYLVRVRPPPA